MKALKKILNQSNGKFSVYGYEKDLIGPMPDCSTFNCGAWKRLYCGSTSIFAGPGLLGSSVALKYGRECHSGYESPCTRGTIIGCD